MSPRRTMKNSRGIQKIGLQICLLGVVIMLINYHIFYNSEAGKQKCKCDEKETWARNKVSGMSPTSVPGFNSVSELTMKLGLHVNLTRWSTSSGLPLYGRHRQRKSMLTLGIPSVRRPNGRNYIMGTIKSIIDNTNDQEKSRITVVIFVADFNETWNLEMANKLYTNFKDYFDEGMLQVVTAPMSIYPDFKIQTVKGEHQDNARRTLWRSKQNLDFAFVMLYSKNISEYYIQLEDDVVCAQHFVNDIEQFVNQTKRFWICLEFTELGFIGKLFRSVHIERLAHTLLAYYDSKPCDLLLGHVFRILGQKAPIHSSPSLFQHMGKWSSLQNKMMPSIDKKFKGFGDKALSIIEVPKGDNPKASLVTNMNWAQGFGPGHAYNHSSSYFWATDPHRRSFFEIIYRWPITITKIIISTGDVRNRKDSLVAGSLRVSDDEPCNAKGTLLGSFVGGEFDSEILGSKIPPGIKCIAIVINNSQTGWLIIRDIAVFVK
ncbi:alpha-1,3-mannosyl-glycoprotein 4-beta-N-acetylglucosaminyltransferase C-like [Mizuhopecten yessoensis]|uniref:Alpha-1,3-mannosyl-glycoprotein 4-beta-N-acetylglucosaminyltransferase C n=1 Tax=Mizuhopecten yessoensis TaxID=6573 RepID=A0A210QUI6_MIZYE|nr:alpha-1,3-mannosyl-glycoprotein 4-beta-N-acetylglucosaminyltransferase C-like [Mizuhopecten yessoensis]OWF52377.1 Alpha-1,3-mannosyl-glycoprotein 4-beta-N-acetylglucosaminyltransferase C [Mizuhopecten yessoensis]